ncbi:TPA: hypothetical protein ACQ71T_002958 [Escherichia coli]
MNFTPGIIGVNKYVTLAIELMIYKSNADDINICLGGMKALLTTANMTIKISEKRDVRNEYT